MGNNIVYGINGHNRGYEAYPESGLEKQIKLAAGIGAKIYRFNYNPTKEDEFEYLNRVTELCAENGMEVMLALDALGIPERRVYEIHSEIARRFKGIIKKYQLFNELDVYCMHTDDGKIYNGEDGMRFDSYNPPRVAECLAKLRESSKAFREIDPDAELIVNFSWWHLVLMDYFVDNGIDYDTIGIDWYHQIEGQNSLSDLLDYVIADKHYEGKNIGICECNIAAWQKYTEEEQSRYLSDILTFIESYRKNRPGGDRLNCFTLYELLDEMAFERGKDYEPEAHFGLVRSDGKGGGLEPKLAYETVKRIYMERQ